MPRSEIHWQYIPRNEQENQPDYHLVVDDRKYAVEITGLMRRIKVGDKHLDEQSIISTLWRFVERIKEESIREEILEGAYVVHFFQPIADFGNVRPKLTRRMLDYISRTGNEQLFPAEVLLEGVCSIQKVHNQRQAIYPVGPGDSGWEGQIRAQACELLKDAITGQLKKKWVGSANLPVILVFLNHYWLAELEVYGNCISDLPLADPLHSIFIIQDDAGLMLFSRESRWQSRTPDAGVA